MAGPRWGTREWFDAQLDRDRAPSFSGWGVQWRGSQEVRLSLCLEALMPVLSCDRPMAVLDVGCARGEFTARAWQVDGRHRFCGMDVSARAVKAASQRLPEVRFAAAQLPHIPFRDGSLDCVVCLEVLYYLDPGDRRRAIESIHRVLRDGGVLLLSGVLDGGARYLDRDEALQLVSERFHVRRVTYNYARLHSALERRLLALGAGADKLRTLLAMAHTGYRRWSHGRSRSWRLRVVAILRAVVSGIPLGKALAAGCLKLTTKVLLAVIAWRWLPAALFHVTKLVLRERGRTGIILLATRR